MKNPPMPPRIAVTRLISMLVLYASLYGWSKSSRTLLNVQASELSWKAPTSTPPAGRMRNRNAYAKNGSVATQASEGRLRPDAVSGRSACCATSVAMLGPYGRRPLLRDELLGSRLLADARELDLRVDRGRRERLRQRCRDDLAGGEVVEPRRVRRTLEPDDLTLVGVEELLPETGCPRMWSGRVDGLRVVAAVDAVRGDREPPLRRGEALDVGEVVVVPVDRDRGLTRRNRGRCRLHGDEVAALLQLREEVDAGLHVA